MVLLTLKVVPRSEISHWAGPVL